ncbi:MAG: hypothetical protein AB2L24_21890 [Mangrovibacterium sp.]
MIADKYIKGMLYQEFTAQVLQKAAPMIMSEQASRVYTYYNERTGHIYDSLQQQAFNVLQMQGGAVLDFGYLIDLRFLDMKTTASGRMKSSYGPVYNKPLWGYVYGYIFGTLRYGLTAKVQSEIFDLIRESYKKPLEQ